MEWPANILFAIELPSLASVLILLSVYLLRLAGITAQNINLFFLAAKFSKL